MKIFSSILTIFIVFGIIRLVLKIALSFIIIFFIFLAIFPLIGFVSSDWFEDQISSQVIGESLIFILLAILLAFLFIPFVVLNLSGMWVGKSYRQLKLLVFSVFLTIVIAGISLNTLFSGSLASWSGEEKIIITGGLAFCIIYLLLFFLNTDIYKRRRLFSSGIVSIILTIWYTLGPVLILSFFIRD